MGLFRRLFGPWLETKSSRQLTDSVVGFRGNETGIPQRKVRLREIAGDIPRFGTVDHVVERRLLAAGLGSLGQLSPPGRYSFGGLAPFELVKVDKAIFNRRPKVSRCTRLDHTI